jgi:voltage-gated potassium channel
MGFVRQSTATVILITITLWLQGAGMALVIHWVRACFARGIKQVSVRRSAVLVIRFTAALIVLHILQILIWAGFYRWHCLPTWESSFYFSATSYSTVGYGDVVLPQTWRSLGPMESVIGVIMCGMSVSGLFAIAIRLIGSESRESSKAETRFASVQVQESGEATLRRPIAK